MPTRLIQLVLDDGDAEAACATLGDLDAGNWWRQETADGRAAITILAKPDEAQPVMDALQSSLDGREGWRLILLPVEATAPVLLDAEEQEAEQRRTEVSAREEILARVQGEGALTRNFLLMAALSMVIGAIGMATDTVAVVIGAMVVAPLLGPLMAFALAVALGDRRMIGRTLVANAAGLGTAVATAAILAPLLPVEPGNRMLDYSEPLTLAALLLPLAAGAAAALATATAKSSAFVGVMVAAALLPPIAAAGLLVASGAPGQALRAAFLVVVNIVGITLAAQVVFVAAGIRPRRWSDLAAARTSRAANAVVLALLVAILAAVILFSDLA